MWKRFAVLNVPDGPKIPGFASVPSVDHSPVTGFRMAEVLFQASATNGPAAVIGTRSEAHPSTPRFPPALSGGWGGP